MHSTRQSALLGASQITVSALSRELSLEAEWGGVARMNRFLTLFPLGLSLFLFVVLTTVFALVLPAAQRSSAILTVGGVCGANALVWVFIRPVMVRQIRNRTHRALDNLLHNVAAVGH